MKNVFTKEAKIGLVSIVSLALLYLGINYLKGINLFKPTNHYVVACTNVKGVTVSSPVFVEGFKVGLVREIVYDYDAVDKISIDISLEDHMKINKGSYITIVNSFLGGGELHIHLNKYVDDYLKPGDTIEGRMESDMMQSVQETLVNHPALAKSLNNIETTTNSLAVSSRQLNQMLSKDVPGIMSDLKVITGNFADVSTDLKKLDLATTVNAVNATLDNVEQMTRKLNSKDNSMGLLLNDRALYDNLNSTADNASKLLLDLRQNPKRYVHFSVF